MTQREAQISHSIGCLAVKATNSNLYAKAYPEKAAEAAGSALFYANWLKDQGQAVEIETTDDGKRITGVRVNGREIVKNGYYVNN